MDGHKQILSTLGNRPTRRKLFGPVDQEQLHRVYQAALHDGVKEASLRWGFDFIQDKPLDSSDFQWEAIPCTKVPLLSRSCMLGVGQAEGHSTAGATRSKKGESVAPLKTSESCTFNLEKLEKTTEQITGAKRKQTNIKDFYQAKRRVVGKPRKSGE